GEGRVSLRPGGPAVSRLCFGAGGECAGARASADREDDSGAGGEADSRLQSLLPRVSGGAGGEVVHALGQFFWKRSRVFFEQRDGGDRGIDQAGAAGGTPRRGRGEVAAGGAAR